MPDHCIAVTVYVLWWLVSRVFIEASWRVNLLEIQSSLGSKYEESTGLTFLPIPLVGDIVICISVLTMLYYLPSWLADVALQQSHRLYRLLFG